MDENHPIAQIRDWNQLLEDKFGSVSAQARSSTDFYARMEAKSISDVMMVRCVSAPARVDHNPARLPKEAKGSFIIKTQLAGRTKLSCGANQLTLEPGDYVICDSARPYVLDLEGDTSIISVPVSGQYLTQFTPFPEDVSFRKAAKENPIRRVAFDYLDSLWRNNAADLSDFARSKLASTFLELAVLSIADESAQNGTGQSQGARQLFDRSCHHIEGSVCNETLSPKSVAEEMGVSLRHLQGVFAQNGWTVSDFISHCRLVQAERLLSSPRYGGRSVGEIAFSLGFNSQAHFSRAFKAKYGRSPSESRRKKSH